LKKKKPFEKGLRLWGIGSLFKNKFAITKSGQALKKSAANKHGHFVLTNPENFFAF
jgi:hypothetical protein